MFAKLMRAFDPSFGHGKKVFERQFFEKTEKSQFSENMDIAIES